MQYIIQGTTLEEELLNISVLFIVLRKKILMVEKQTFFQIILMVENQTFFQSYLYEISRPLAFFKIEPYSFCSQSNSVCYRITNTD